MTRTQIEYLKWLGYEDTKEDGAILQYRRMGSDGFVWKGAKFKDVMQSFTANYKRGYLKQCAKSIINEI